MVRSTSWKGELEMPRPDIKQAKPATRKRTVVPVPPSGHPNPSHGLALSDVRRRLNALADPKRADGMCWYFKTGPGEYGAGDKFLGISVPKLRQASRVFAGCSREVLQGMLGSEWHEERLLALFVLVRQYVRGSERERDAIFQLYLANTARINNWDLVDASAPYIVGPHVSPDAPAVLVRLARSASIWERRIAILATFDWVKRGRFEPALRIAELLLEDKHDLIHKAVGWMLREVGKRDQAVEEQFLKKHYRRMPRTMLRYAIERFPEGLRRQYLKGEVPGT